MKCEKCGNEYTSQYYFTTNTICNDCFSKLSAEEQQYYQNRQADLINMDQMSYRIKFGKRLGALLIDYAIITIVVLIIYNMNGFFSSYMQLIKDASSYSSNPEMLKELQTQFMNENLVNFYFSNILTLVYFALEVLIGASLGKLILGIQIASEDRKKAGYGKLLYRFALKNCFVFFSILMLFTGAVIFNYLVTLCWLTIIIGCFFALSAKRQTLHDKIARTAVFNKTDVLDEDEVQLI